MHLSIAAVDIRRDRRHQSRRFGKNKLVKNTLPQRVADKQRPVDANVSQPFALGRYLFRCKVNVTEMIEHAGTTLERVPNAIAKHLGPIRLTVIRTLAMSRAKRKASFGDVADKFKIAKGIEQVQQTRICRAKSAFERIGRRL